MISDFIISMLAALISMLLAAWALSISMANAFDVEVSVSSFFLLIVAFRQILLIIRDIFYD